MAGGAGGCGAARRYRWGAAASCPGGRRSQMASAAGRGFLSSSRRSPNSECSSCRRRPSRPAQQTNRNPRKPRLGREMCSSFGLWTVRLSPPLHSKRQSTRPQNPMARDCGRGGESRDEIWRRGRTGSAMAARRVRGAEELWEWVGGGGGVGGQRSATAGHALVQSMERCSRLGSDWLGQESRGSGRGRRKQGTG